MRARPGVLSERPRRGADRKTVREVPARDVLTDVLDTLGLEGRVYCRTVLGAPWAFAVPRGDLAHFHAVERGGAWLRLDGEADPISLGPDDLVVLPRGRGHQLGDSPRRRPVALQELVGPGGGGRCVTIQHGGDGPRTHLICGAFRFRRADRHPLLDLLPEVLVLRAGAPTTAWVAGTLRLLGAEVDARRPGAQALLSRLTEVLFVQVVRAWIDQRGGEQGTWLDALRDPPVGAALALIHERLEEPWTLARLATAVGLSRSALAARFRALVGEAPFAYLTRWRMERARGLLEDRSRSVAQVAALVGYESEPAFRKAFKRVVGATPGAHRRRR